MTPSQPHRKRVRHYDFPAIDRIKQFLVAEQNPLLNELIVRQRPGVSTFRFWQEGPGFDRNLTTEKAILATIQYLHLNLVRRRLCRQSDE